MPDETALDPIAEARRQWEAHGWADAAPGMAAVTSIMRVQQLLLQRIDAVLRPLGLTFARYEVLMLLSFSSRGSLPMTKVGDRLQVHPASVTSAVDRLQSQGYVQRRRHPDDGRAVLAEITPAGRRIATRATRALNDGVFTDLGVDAAALRSLLAGLDRLRAAAEGRRPG